jgi:hypothetical protein
VIKKRYIKMASRYYTSQFNYSFERMAVTLMGSATQTDLGAFATLVDNGITWTAVTMGAAGNSITVALVAGGTAGAEVVTVTGNAISVQIESGVSTRTQVLTAVQASAEASALVNISVASGGTAATLLAATPLATGDDTDFTIVGLSSVTLSQIGTGLFKLAIADAYANLLACSIMIQRASGAVDLVAQLATVDTSSAKAITFRTNAGATPTNLANSDVLYIRLELRNSSQTP